MAEERDERTRELLRRAQLYNVSHHDKLARTRPLADSAETIRKEAAPLGEVCPYH